MNLDQTTVPLEPRRALGCIDVAVQFFGRHVVPLLVNWLHVTLPACVLLYILLVRSEMDWRLAVVVIYVATWPLTVLTIAGTSRALFGESFAPPPASSSATVVVRTLQTLIDVATVAVAAVVLADVSADVLGTDFVHGAVELVWYLLLFGLLTARLVVFLGRRAATNPGFLRTLLANGLRRAVMAIGPALLLFPLGTGLVLLGLLLCILTLVLAVRKSFIPESVFLSKLDEQLHGQGADELIKKEGGDLFFRGCLILGFLTVLGLVVFFSVDQASNLLLGYPILLGRLDQVFASGESNALFGIASQLDKVVPFLMRDARCLTVLTGSILFVFPIMRIAWFFCYIDLRVRRDCWDMELRFRQEARRLEGLT